MNFVSVFISLNSLRVSFSLRNLHQQGQGRMSSKFIGEHINMIKRTINAEKRWEITAMKGHPTQNYGLKLLIKGNKSKFKISRTHYLTEEESNEKDNNMFRSTQLNLIALHFAHFRGKPLLNESNQDTTTNSQQQSTSISEVNRKITEESSHKDLPCMNTLY